MSVKYQRNRLGISQEELAERAGLHRTYICDIERGARNVTLESIGRLAHALGISIPALLSDPGKLSLNGDLVEVLYVEDLQDDIDLTLQALASANIANHVRVARNGETAIQLLFDNSKSSRAQENLPDLVLLDLGLPGINGLEVLRRIKADSRTRKIPVVVLTASRRDRDLAASKQLGADAYIVKPVDFQNLSEVTPKLSLHWALIKQHSAAGLDQVTRKPAHWHNADR